jgi:Thioredoxin
MRVFLLRIVAAKTLEEPAWGMVAGTGEEEAAAKRQAAVTAEHDKLFGDSTSPIAGNPNGDVTVVEFFDYQCGFCKTSQDAVSKLLSADRNVKFIYKEYPIDALNAILRALRVNGAEQRGITCYNGPKSAETGLRRAGSMDMPPPKMQLSKALHRGIEALWQLSAERCA